MHGIMHGILVGSRMKTSFPPGYQPDGKLKAGLASPALCFFQERLDWEVLRWHEKLVPGSAGRMAGGTSA